MSCCCWTTGCPTDQQSLFFDEATFFDQLEDMHRVHASNNYTIILSHSPGERSYRSTSLACSVFTFAGSLGLSGMADLNRDRSVTVDELFRFIAGATQTIVQNESVGPRLSIRNCWGVSILTCEPAWLNWWSARHHLLA